MTPSLLFNAAVKGMIEGITEFLPISSTGHLILMRQYFPLTTDPSRLETLDNLFDIVIQLPAIFAVLILFRKNLWNHSRQIFHSLSAQRFWRNVILAFLPAAFLGVLLRNQLDYLMKPAIVAAALILGGIIIIGVERLQKIPLEIEIHQMSARMALKIGFIQCLSMIPGTSRSGATIIGGRLLGLSRNTAAEFSFYLAIPTMIGAFALKFLKEWGNIHWSSDGGILLIGSLSSFLTAWAVVSLFIRFIQKYSLEVFGWYRLVLGVLILGNTLL